MGDCFRDLKPALHAEVLSCLEEVFGFTTMTPVQKACIPLFRENKDVAVEAVTGSGKTLAFLVPVVERLLGRQEALSKQEVGAIIIGPTRELAEQIHGVLGKLLSCVKGLSSLLLVGGKQSVADDLERWGKGGGHIIVATPGRLLDVLQRKILHLHELEVLVLDEADRLLDMGFSASLSAILKFLPKQRRTGLFSATQTESIEQLMRAGLRNPVRIRVKVENAKTRALQTLPEKLSSYYVTVPLERKLDALFSLLTQHKNEKVIVYFLTCATVDYMFKIMSGFTGPGAFLEGLRFFSFHGKIPAKKRDQLLERFSSQSSGVLLVTDVAARGIDFPNVDWVVQWDPPQDPAAFTHRIGRTARSGKAGNGVVFLTEEEVTYVDFLSRKQIQPELMTLPPMEEWPLTFDQIRERAVGERELYEKSHEAFVSYVRGYREHVCSFIFELKRLDLGLLAKCFGLLRFPAMPELRGRRPESFVPHPVKHGDIPYKDPSREAQRLAKIAQANSLSDKEKKEHAREEKSKTLKLHRKKKVVIASHEFTDRDLDELALEARLLKKERKSKGRLTAQEVDSTMFETAKKRDRDAQLEELKKKERRKKRKLKKLRSEKDPSSIII